jgi:serine phosphatase RsbU (regulator of sigma subunit)
MSGFRAALMSQDVGRETVPVLAARMNHFLYRSVETGRFVTAFVAMLDGKSGRLAYTNAGHNPPLVVRRDGQVERLTEGGCCSASCPMPSSSVARPCSGWATSPCSSPTA